MTASKRRSRARRQPSAHRPEFDQRLANADHSNAFTALRDFRPLELWKRRAVLIAGADPDDTRNPAHVLEQMLDKDLGPAAQLSHARERPTDGRGRAPASNAPSP